MPVRIENIPEVIAMHVKNSSVPSHMLPHGAGRQHQAFSNLRGEASGHFRAMGMTKSYERGDKLFHEGDPSELVFVIRKGRIKISVSSREGRTMIFRIAESGQVLGLGAALTSSEHEATAEALEPSRVTALRTEDFVSFLRRYPDAAIAATRCILKDYELALEEVCQLALMGSVAGRLASLLTNWQKKHYQPGDTEHQFGIGLTHDEIASMTATTRETVSRVLQQFQREKLISIHGRCLTVLQPEALEALGT
jgi:CRP/FNR family cyclic AMP-dependent transcriptional regulator